MYAATLLSLPLLFVLSSATYYPMQISQQVQVPKNKQKRQDGDAPSPNCSTTLPGGQFYGVPACTSDPQCAKGWNGHSQLALTNINSPLFIFYDSGIRNGLGVCLDGCCGASVEKLDRHQLLGFCQDFITKLPGGSTYPVVNACHTPNGQSWTCEIFCNDKDHTCPDGIASPAKPVNRIPSAEQPLCPPMD